MKEIHTCFGICVAVKYKLPYDPGADLEFEKRGVYIVEKLKSK